jgi:hypothetical protein
MAVGESFGQPVRWKPAAVVFDEQLELLADLGEANSHVRCVRVLHHVGDELAGYGERLLLARMACRVPKIEPQHEPGLLGGPLRDRAQCGLEPRFLQNVWVQIEHRIPELANGLGERGVGATQGGVRRRLRRLVELVARRE